MKKAIITLFFTFSLCSISFRTADSEYLDFLRTQKTSAKQYVINLFKDNDIVILCERDHKEFTQYELFLEIVRDPYFIEHVGHIFTEVGVKNMDSEIREFLHSKQPDSISARNKITSLFRNIDYAPYWHCYNYPWFIGELFKVNQNLNKDKKILLHPSDYEFDWSKCRTANDYKNFDSKIDNRDSVLASNIIDRFTIIQAASNRKKALVILNYKHAFLKDHMVSGKITRNAGRYLSERFQGKTASVYLMGLAIPVENTYTVVKDGKWDYFFESLKKENIGFDFLGSPFGKEDFDVIPPDSRQNLKYQDMFTGIIFYKSISEHLLKTGWNGFGSGEFLPELQRRINIFNEAMGLGMTEEELNNKVLDNNLEKTSQYKSIESLRKKVDKWRENVE